MIEKIIVLNRPLYNSAWNAFENLGRLRSSEERGDHFPIKSGNLIFKNMESAIVNKP